MFNFFRRSKTKDNIEYNRKNRVETFKQLSQETSAPEISAALAAPAPQRLVKRSKTMEITTVPFVINSKVSASTSSLPKNPYVANICDLVYLNNNEAHKSVTFKDLVMAPAMGWRNKKQKRKKQQKTHASPSPPCAVVNATIEETKKNPRENPILRTFSANIENDFSTTKNNVELEPACSSNTTFPKVCKEDEMGGNQVSKAEATSKGNLNKNESEPIKTIKNESGRLNLIKTESGPSNLKDETKKENTKNNNQKNEINNPKQSLNTPKTIPDSTNNEISNNKNATTTGKPLANSESNSSTKSLNPDINNESSNVNKKLTTPTITGKPILNSPNIESSNNKSSTTGKPILNSPNNNNNNQLNTGIKSESIDESKPLNTGEPTPNSTNTEISNTNKSSTTGKPILNSTNTNNNKPLSTGVKNESVELNKPLNTGKTTINSTNTEISNINKSSTTGKPNSTNIETKNSNTTYVNTPSSNGKPTVNTTNTEISNNNSSLSTGKPNSTIINNNNKLINNESSNTTNIGKTNPFSTITEISNNNKTITTGRPNLTSTNAENSTDKTITPSDVNKQINSTNSDETKLNSNLKKPSVEDASKSPKPDGSLVPVVDALVPSSPHLRQPKKPALKTNESKSSSTLRVSFSEDASSASKSEVLKCEVPKPLTVCSIAIPLPNKILKSDKIPVTSVIERTEFNKGSTEKPKENGEVGNDLAGNNGETKPKNLVNQEERFQTQITDLKKQLEKRDQDALQITYEMEDLHRDVFVKSSGMERLQAELTAANKESEYIRKRLRHLEDDLQTFRDKNNDLTEDLEKKTEDYDRLQQTHDQQISELEQNVRHLIQQIQLLETHNAEFRAKIEQMEKERNELQYERDEEKKIVQNAIETAIAEKQSIQLRWEKDFEKLRTVNTTREQQLLDDFEWKLREVEQSCKKRLDDKEKQIQVQLRTAEQQLNEVIHLKSYEAEVKQLRGLTDEQQQSIGQLSQRINELQLNEQQLREEVIKLLKQIELDNGKMVAAKQQFEMQLQEKSREMHVELDRQRGEVAVQWEERMYQECARLKLEMEQIHNEEKGEAVQTVKKQKQQEYDHLKKIWEKRIEECDKEISSLKKNLTEKEESYQKEFERIQTKADRDIMELRRSLDKTDMTYNDQIEKLTENHDKELARLSEEYEKKIKDVETNWQMQVTSTRTTLELVKEQMERDSQDKLQALDQHHRSQLERQWDQLVQDKEEALQQMEQNYRNNCMKLKEEICNLQKANVDKESKLQATIDALKVELDGKNSQLLCLQNNVDTLHGGIHVLNREIKNHGHEMQKIQNTCEKKIRHVRDSLLAEQSRRINQLKLQHAGELEMVERKHNDRAEHLDKKCQCLSKLFEEMRTRFNEKDAMNTENENVIAELRQQIAEQRMQIENLTQKSYCSKSEQKEYQRKGGGTEKVVQNLPDLTNTMGTDF